MPSPLGHAFAGLAIGVIGGAGQHRGSPRRWRLPIFCAALACAPDLDLLTPIPHRTFTHSLFAVAAVSVVAMPCRSFLAVQGAVRMAALAGAAFGSHLVLDWMGVDPGVPAGLQLLWPVGGWYVSGWDVFPPTTREALLSARSLWINGRAAVWEVIILGGAFLATLRIRRLGDGRRLRRS